MTMDAEAEASVAVDAESGARAGKGAAVGPEPISDEAFDRMVNTLQARLSWRQAEACVRDIEHHVAALTAAVDRAGEERARRECAEELRAMGGWRGGNAWLNPSQVHALIAKWSAPTPPSGAGEEGETG